MFREELLNSTTPVKSKRLGTRSEVAARMADETMPKIIGIPGPNGGYIIRPTKTQIMNHQNWCYNWRVSMGGAWLDNLENEESTKDPDAILFEMFNVDTQEELDYAIECNGGY